LGEGSVCGKGLLSQQNPEDEMISVEDYLFFVDEAIDGMIGTVTQLGDDLANVRSDMEGANSPYAILTHCLGVTEYWAGYIVAGRAIERDRAAEFRAAGPVTELVARAKQARRQFGFDLAYLDSLHHPAGSLTRRMPA
jgi:hypothetical protein